MDAFGDRMKMYENMSTFDLMPLLPVLARIDGRSFHSFTAGMERPYDALLSKMMISLATILGKETNASVVYTQSDEISLLWYSDDRRSQIWFDGKHSKMVSQLAALATLYFYRLVLGLIPNYAERLPSFDARVWTVPNKTEAANVFLWRELDATKNSISMAARAVFSDKQLHGKSGEEKKRMLLEKGVDWHTYPSFFKRGTFIQRRRTLIPFAAEEIELLPPKHEARTNPDLKVERSEWVELEMPPFQKVKNREQVIFDGATPVV